MEVNNKKLKRSINIYPIFYGLSADLIFWIAINTLFLTTVKGLSASQINSIEAIATGIGIIFQLFLVKIVRKIGNLNSVRLGVTLLFLAAVLNTFCTHYLGFLIAELCYTIGFVFKHMDNVILIKNLKYINKSDDYIKIQTKGSMIYSFVTLIISLLSGFLFNINPYIPMILCMTICFINILLTYFIYEVPLTKKEEVKTNKKVHINKSILYMVLLYGLFYALINTGQKNSKLFVQLNMQEFLSLNKVAIYMSIFIFISRVSRLTSNLIFITVYNKLKNKIIYLLELGLVGAFSLLLVGNFIGRNMIGIWTMALGFFIFLLIRDPFDNYLRKILFDNSKEEVHDKIVNYITLSRKIFSLSYSMIVSMMLFNLNYVYVMTLLLVIAISFIILIKKVYQIVEQAK